MQTSFIPGVKVFVGHEVPRLGAPFTTVQILGTVTLWFGDRFVTPVTATTSIGVDPDQQICHHRLGPLCSVGEQWLARPAGGGFH